MVFIVLYIGHEKLKQKLDSKNCATLPFVKKTHSNGWNCCIVKLYRFVFVQFFFPFLANSMSTVICVSICVVEMKNLTCNGKLRIKMYDS